MVSILILVSIVSVVSILLVSYRPSLTKIIAIVARLVARVYTFAEMSILRYFKPKDSLPDPKGSLSASMSSEAIASANGEDEVREAMASYEDASFTHGVFMKIPSFDGVFMRQASCSILTVAH